MARIRISGTADALRVSIAGRLMVTDMGRLEHACGPALVACPLTLELDLRAVTAWDAHARALIDRLAARGATVMLPGEVPPNATSTTSILRRRVRYRLPAKRTKPAINSR